jgi:energy-coupling factor transporter ATP-binding protein EcfA2
MRYFNTLGPVNETEHYVVPRRELIADLVAQIERGTYFTLYAPRQMGKTTLLRQLAEVLLEKPDYLPVTLSFEAFESWSVSDFLHGFSLDLSRNLLDFLKESSHPNFKLAEEQKRLMNKLPTSFFALREWFVSLHQWLPELKFVLIIDEFDATPQAAISNLLQIWRQIYLANGPPRPLHSVILIGLQNIATLNLGRSSPFNIARQIQLLPFTLAEMQALFNQYTQETAQSLAEGVIKEIHVLTGGQPFLVNRLAAIITEEIATERTRPISHANLLAALSKLVRERNYNYETLVRHAKSFQEPLLRILFGARLKIWYGAAAFDEGLDQLEGYLETEGQSVGYYVVFHARPKVYGKLTYEEMERVEQRERVKIYVYLVRLGV